MNRIYRISFIAATFLTTGCVALPRPYTPSYTAPQAKSFPDIVHAYELLTKDSAGQPIEGGVVTFTSTVEGKTTSTKIDCVTDANGICKTEVLVPQDPKYSNYFESYASKMSYTVTKSGFYSGSGTLSSSFGSKHSYTKGSPVKEVLTLYKPTDYLSEAFVASTTDRELRDQALKFMSLIRLRSLIVDADVMLRGMGMSTFKSKKYFQMKINTTTTFNSLKLGKL